MQIFLYSNSKAVLSQLSTWGRKVVKRCQRSKILPLKVWVLPVTKAPNSPKDSSMAIEFLCFVLPEKKGNIFSAYRELSSTYFPSHFLVHLWFQPCKFTFANKTKMATQILFWNTWFQQDFKMLTWVMWAHNYRKSYWCEVSYKYTEDNISTLSR